MIRALLGVIGVVVAYYVMPLIGRDQPIPRADWAGRFPAMLWEMWIRFDSAWYLGIARDWYANAASLVPGQQSNWAFFPLYPMLIRAVASPFGGGYDALVIAGLAISTAAAFVAAAYLYRLVSLELGERTAARAVLYLGLYPMGFYLWAVYTESLFLALMIAAVYYARRRRWLLAGVIAGLAALTRPQGVLLLPILGWEYWGAEVAKLAAGSIGDPFAGMRWGERLRSRLLLLRRALSRRDAWLGLGALLPIPAAFAAFLLHSWILVGQPLAFSLAERYGWGRRLTNPLSLVLHSLWPPAAASPYEWNFYVLNLAALAIFGIALYFIWRRLPSVYLVTAVLLYLLPLSSGDIQSLSRYYLAIFPAFMVLAMWTSREGRNEGFAWHEMVVTASAMLLSLGMVLFTLTVYSVA